MADEFKKSHRMVELAKLIVDGDVPLAVAEILVLTKQKFRVSVLTAPSLM